MNLIDRYIREIGRRLPQKNRVDIEKEIRSALEDMLEDRSKKESRAVDEEMTIQVVKEYGNPQKVAASYLPEQYLIGPQLFPFFWLVVQIVFGVLTALTLVALVLHFAGGDFLPVEIGKSFFTLLANYFGGLMTAFGNIVLVFALIQRFAPSWKEDLKDEDEDWNPRDLPDVEDRDQVSRTEAIVETVFIVLGLILFNIYPQYIGIYGFTTDNGSFFVPILSQAFFNYMPWINLLWGLQIALNALLIQRMRWQIGTRWFLIAIKAGEVALAYAMLNGPSLLNLTPATLMTEMNFSADAAQTFANLLGRIVIFALWIGIIAGAVEIIQVLIKIVRAQFAPATA
jgi:hypothetical protein